MCCSHMIRGAFLSRVGTVLVVSLSVFVSPRPVLCRIGRVVSSWLRRLVIHSDRFLGRGEVLTTKRSEIEIVCTPSLHAPRAGT